MPSSGLFNNPGMPASFEEMPAKFPGKNDVITSQKLPVLSGYLYAYMSSMFYSQRNNMNHVPIAQDRRFERVDDNQLLTSIHLPAMPVPERLILSPPDSNSRASPAVPPHQATARPNTQVTTAPKNLPPARPQVMDFSPKEEQMLSTQFAPLDERLLDSQLIRDLVNREKLLDQRARDVEATIALKELLHRAKGGNDWIAVSPNKYDCSWIGLSERATSSLPQPVLNSRWKQGSPPQTCRPYFARSRDCTSNGAEMIFTASLCAFVIVIAAHLIPQGQLVLRWIADCPAMIASQFSNQDKPDAWGATSKQVSKARASRGTSRSRP